MFLQSGTSPRHSRCLGSRHLHSKGVNKCLGFKVVNNYRNLIKISWVFVSVLYRDLNVFWGGIGPGFLNQAPTLGFRGHWGLGLGLWGLGLNLKTCRL